MRKRQPKLIDVDAVVAKGKYPFKATWRNNDYDQPVKITSFAGKFGDTVYFYREGSQTGIPANQLYV